MSKLNWLAVPSEPPLTAEEVECLPADAEIMVLWSGGNGPWPYRVTVHNGQRCADNGRHSHSPELFNTPLTFVGPERFHTKVWRGWADDARAWRNERDSRPVGEGG